MQKTEIEEIPYAVWAETEEGSLLLEKKGDGWKRKDVCVIRRRKTNGIMWVLAAEESRVRRIVLKWKTEKERDLRLLSDHWERAYGDLEWRGICPERVMPWYFVGSAADKAVGYGVKTGCGAFCHWKVTEESISLVMDVCSLGKGVWLQGKQICMAETVSVCIRSSEREGDRSKLAFVTAEALCRKMCEAPLLPPHSVYGGNNWYYAYGQSSESEILEDTKRIAEWSEGLENRPYMVVDACWQEVFVNGQTCSGGPYERGNKYFPDMKGMAAKIKEKSVRPGLWCRPLLTSEEVPKAWILDQTEAGNVLDPTVPEVLEKVGRDIRHFADWGYELIKHDFSTYDLLGKWGFEMGEKLTDRKMAFSDPSVTTAQAIRSLYLVIKEAAGDALVLGCNTVGHLAAGLVHIQRTGDDTSGLEWERTRKMGINTLAFRMGQHETFYAADGDCVGLTEKIPWEKNRQWMELLAKSGTPLFVSADSKACGKEQEEVIREAFRLASRKREKARPIDWMETTAPREWEFTGERKIFIWNE